MLMSRSYCVRVCAQKQTSKSSAANVQALRKRFEDARAPVVRDSWNKLVAIASIDTKFAGDVFKELDTFHKNIVDEWRNGTARDKSVALVTRSSDDEENIFKAN